MKLIPKIGDRVRLKPFEGEQPEEFGQLIEKGRYCWTVIIEKKYRDRRYPDDGLREVTPDQVEWSAPRKGGAR